MGIYNQEDRLEKARRKLKQSNLSSNNKDLLEEWMDHLMAEDLSDHKIYRYLQTFRVLEPVIDFELDAAEKKDLVRLAGRINQNQIPNKDYAASSKAELKKAIRRFYTWQTGEDEPEIIGFLSTSVKSKDRSRVDPSRLPHPKQVRLMVENAENKRDKALIAVLWESGARIGELLTLDWSDVKLFDDYAELELDGKTGTRYVPIFESKNLLENWRLEQLPENEDRPVWVSFQSNKQIGYQAVRHMLKRNNKADCKDNPHAFRKSRATFLASQGANIFQLMELFGWSKAQTAKTYVRLAQSDTEKLVLKVARQSQLTEHEPEDYEPAEGIQGVGADQLTSALI